MNTEKELLYVSTQEIADEINGVMERVITRNTSEDEDIWIDDMDNELSGTSEATQDEAFDTITRESIAGIIVEHLNKK